MTTRIRRSLLSVGTLVLLLAAPLARSGTAAIASPDSYGADTAAKILRDGGNAVDAAVAVAFTLAVTYPEAGNLGGGGFATILVDGKPYFLDYRESAARTASAGMYLDAAGNVIPDASTVGVRAVSVPGTVRGLWELHRRFARLSWQADLALAIRYAERGFVADKLLAERREHKEKLLGTRTNFRHYFHGVRAGTVFRQPVLASTLRRIAADGPAGFYGGRTAELIVAEMRRGGGLIGPDDLSDYQAAWGAPLEADWEGYRIISAPPPSSGGIALLQMLAMKQYLAPAFADVAPNSAQYVHLVAEIEKRVFADRAEYLGDPRFNVAALLDPVYLARRASEVNTVRPTPTIDVKPGLVEHHNTTHFSIVDRWGNAVSNTYSLNDWFGCGQVVSGAGFLLNNTMDDFSTKPGAPNIFGVVGGTANAIVPGKRPLSSMTPTILTRDGRVALVIGSEGGSRMFTSVFQVTVNWHDYQMPLGKAVSEARFHHQLLPPDTLFEEPYKALPPATRAALIERGYKLENDAWGTDIQAVEVDGDRSEAVSDPRGRGVGRVFD